MIWDYPLIVALGAMVGLVSSVLGLGGGILIVPLLPMLVALSQQEAVATSLFTIFLVVSNNTRSFHRQNLVDWHMVWVIGPTSALAAYAAGSLGLWVPEWVLILFLEMVLVAAILRSMWPAKVSISRSSVTSPGSKRIWGAGVGGLAGLLSGLSGVGAGLLVSPLTLNLKLLAPVNVAPTSNAVMIFTTAFGVLAYLQQGPFSFRQAGQVHLDLALILAVSAFMSSYLGRRWQRHLPTHWRRWLLSLLLVLLAAKVALQLWAEFQLRQ